MYTYLSKKGIVTSEYIFDDIKPGQTLDDLENGKIILLNEDQSVFYYKNPDCSHQEIFLMKKNPELEIERIRKKREQLYEKESDHFYIAYQKYLIQGNMEKAEQQKQKWLDKIEEIKLNNPYPEDSDKKPV